MKKIFYILIIPALIFHIASAQNSKSLESWYSQISPVQIQDGVSCFEYYKFGSVQTSISPGSANTVSGVDVNFTGNIQNKNNYPIVDGGLYVKILYLDNHEKNSGNSPEVVDEFLAEDNIYIKPNSSVNFNFNWKVPNYISSGNYKAVTYFISGEKINFQGLSFSEDIIGGSTEFRIKSEVTDSVKFSKSQTEVQNKKYLSASFPPNFDNAPVKIKTFITNSSKTSQEVKVNWSIYKWDAQKRNNIISSEDIVVKVPANTTLPLTYTINDNNHSVYYVVPTLFWQDTKSILGIRFIRNQNDEARVSFSSLLNYPARKDKNLEVVSCIHNTGKNTTENESMVSVSVLDQSNNVLSQKEYKTKVGEAMTGIKTILPNNFDLDIFRIKVDISEQNKIVDSLTLSYNCKDIDKTLCIENFENMSTSQGLLEEIFNYEKLREGFAIITVLVILSVSFTVLFRWYRKNYSYENQNK